MKKATPKANRRLPARGSTAFIAFWLMHIEAQRDSGLSVPRYARAHHLPERMLQRVKLRFTRTPPAQDGVNCVIRLPVPELLPMQK